MATSIGGLSQQYANQAGANHVYKGPVFDEVLPYYKSWEALLPSVQQEASRQVNPGIQRQLRQTSRDIYNNLAGSGGGRFGSSWGQLGNAAAEAERNRRAQTLDLQNTYEQGYKTLWYDPSRQNFNRAIENGQVPGVPNALTWQQFQGMMGGGGMPSQTGGQTPQQPMAQPTGLNVTSGRTGIPTSYLNPTWNSLYR